jgi:hypothetical protein
MRVTGQDIPSVTTGVTGIASPSVVATADAYYNPPGIGSMPASGCEVTVSDNLIASGSGSGFLSFSLLGEAESDPTVEVNGSPESSYGEWGSIPDLR